MMLPSSPWASVADFVDMGGFGLYVWGACTMVGAAALWEALTLVQRRRRALDELQQRQREAARDAG